MPCSPSCRRTASTHISMFSSRKPLPADHPLRDLDNVFLSPHISGHTVENRLRLVEEIARDIERFFNNEPLRLVVPYEKLKIMA